MSRDRAAANFPLLAEVAGSVSGRRLLREVTFPRITCGELFCGAGGLAIGGEWAGVSSVWGVDINRAAIKTYRRNIQGGNGLLSDVRKLDYSRLERPEILSFGFPCNDFSIIGRLKGVEGKYGSLYKECVRAVSELRPAQFLAENVPMVRKYLPLIIGEFSELGYEVTAEQLNAAQYGVPQTRERIFIVGRRRDLNMPPHRFPQPYIADVSAETALADIPEGAPNNELWPCDDGTRERLAYVPPGKSGRGCVPAELLPERWRDWKDRGLSIYSCWLRRLAPEEPSYTIVAGGDTHYHWSEDRQLTNRELARLHTYPDRFVFEGALAQVRSQIGMSVPPLMAKHIFDSMLGDVYHA